MLRSRARVDERSREMLNDMQLAADRAAELSKQLMIFSKESLLESEIADLKVIVADSDSVLRRLVGVRVGVSMKYQSDACTIEVNPTQIEQVLFNLVVNARDATPPGGQVLVEVRRVTLAHELQLADGHVPAGEHVLLVVSDTGKGMDEYTISRIFEPFFTTKNVGKGTGMGSAVVYGIVRQNSGPVDVESNVGTGATFRVYFPYVERLD